MTNKPYISVIVPTNRVGGLDILFECLKYQNFQDFELVLVDALFQYRKNIVIEKSKKYNFVVKHIEPLPNSFPITNYCKSINTGLCVSDGTIVYFSCDHAFLTQDILLTHANFHKKQAYNHALILHVNDCKVNPEKISDILLQSRQYGTRGKDKEVQLLIASENVYVGEHNKWSDMYKEDLENGQLNGVLWSIFKEPFTFENGMNNLVISNSIDTKFNNCPIDTPISVFHDLCCMKNDSFKRNFLLDANGLDEDMDGTHGFQDTELARRLARVHGCQFFAMNSSPVSVINTRYYLEPRKIIKGYNNNSIIVNKNLKETKLINNTITQWKEQQ